MLIYVVAFILSIGTYKKYFDTALRYFPIIIAYTFFNELLGYFIRFKETFAFSSEEQFANDIIYNIYYVIFFGYFFFVYWNLVANKNFKRWIRWLAYIGILAFIINSFFYNPLTTSLFYAISIASWFLLSCIIIYLYNLPDWKWGRDKYNLMTWISVGLVVFFFLFPILYLIGFLKYEIWEQYHLRTVLRILIIVMYGFFCIGFVISRRRAFR